MLLMILLPNGCYRSEIEVTPKNWNQKPTSKKAEHALIAKEWRIYYRFYDPRFKDTDKWGKLISVKGMNGHKDLSTRQDVTAALLNKEKEKLDKMGYSPLTGVYSTPEVDDETEDIGPSTPFIMALNKALEMATCCEAMKSDIEGMIKRIGIAADKIFDSGRQQYYSSFRIGEVSRKHLIYIFKQCAKDNPRFTPNRQNKYRTALMILFKKLLSLEAIDSNPVNDIPIERGIIKKKPRMLSEPERIIIDTNLKAWDYYYWRYMRIFFRSGSRSTELLALKVDSVDIQNQEFTVLVKKGQLFEEQLRPIPDDVIHLWLEILSEIEPGEYLFSSYFMPGTQIIDNDYVSKRWKKYVKNDPGKFDPFKKGWGLGIKVDFYKLKHLNTDTIDALLDLNHAAAADGHTETSTTKKHYALGHEERKREALKRVEVKFT